MSLNAVTASDSVSAAEDPAEPAALPDLATALRTAPLAKSSESAGAEAPAQILSRLNDGTYVMVNYQDSSAAISTDNPVLTGKKHGSPDRNEDARKDSADDFL